MRAASISSAVSTIASLIFLLVFGKNVEDAFGHLRYLVFYFAGGFVAMLTQAAITLLFGTTLESRIPNLGAGGAIAAVLGAYSSSTPPPPSAGSS